MKLFALFLLCSCATATQTSAPQVKNRVGCVITCPGGYIMRRQHICRGDKRWFQEVVIRAEHITRGSDGGILSDTYETTQGDYAKEDVELGTCSSVIARFISMRGADERGQHVGEDPQGNPLNPPQR